MGVRLGSSHSGKNINRVFKNGTVRRIFVHKKGDVTAG
jgi:hypothetical protein